MSIPPLLSNTPPPINGHIEDEDDNDFGDFRTADLSYDDNENSSSSPSIDNSPKHAPFSIPLDINSNKDEGKNNDDENVLNKANKSKNLDEIRVNNELNVSAVEKDCLQNEEISKCEENGILIKNDEFGEFNSVIPTNNFINCDKECERIENLENKPENLEKDDNSDIIQNNLDSKDIIVEKHIEFDLEKKNLEPIASIEKLKDAVLKESPTNCSTTNEFQDLSSFIHKDLTNDCYTHKTESLKTSEIKLEDTSSESKIENLNANTSQHLITKNYVLDNKESCLDSLNSDSDFTEKIENISKSDDVISESKDDDVQVEISNETPEDSKLHIVSANVGIHSSLLDNDKKEIDSKSNEEPIKNYQDDEIVQRQENPVEEDDDFGEFSDFASSSTVPQAKSLNSLDDFGDFAHFDDFPSPPTIILDSYDAKIKAEIILKEIFPLSDTSLENEQMFSDIVANDEIFNKLKDITETPALKYQWSDSATQKQFLKALNIDTRNILYGPAWNPSMPRFAANLGVTLEPIKADILTPSAAHAQVPTADIETSQIIEGSSKNNSEDIPKADFDWSSSGLVNPLEEPPLNEATDKSNQMEYISSIEAYNPKNLDLSSLETQTFTSSSKVSSVSTTASIPPELEDIFSSTGSISKPTIDLPNLIPLRETHISVNNSDNNQTKKLELDWLDPLPETKIDSTEFDNKKIDPVSNFRIESNQSNRLSETKIHPPVGIFNLESLSNNKIDLAKSQIDFDDGKDDFDDFQSVLPNNELKQTSDSKIDNKKENVSTESIKSSNLSNNISNGLKMTETSVDDDEFTDFYSSAPRTITPQPAVVIPLQPQTILEPLKPAVVHNNISQGAQINWPDPGLTDDDIKHIELSFAQPLTPPTNQSPCKTEPKISNSKLTQNDIKDSKDDDEWSDFVSVPKPSPKRIVDLNERSSTPDLPLSVFNLSSIQSPKKSIPVITPQGLVQTKLTSHFVSTCGTSLKNDSKFSKGGSVEDDDWSDFVSSPAVNTFWSNAVPKQETMSVVKNAKSSGSAKVVMQSKRSTIPSISEMPDLDFGGLKRTSHRK